MTVIAHRHGIIAMDSQGTNNGHAFKTVKFKLVEAEGKIEKVIAFTGDLDTGLEFSQWYIEGAKADKFPKAQEGDKWSRIIVADKNGVVWYEQSPYAMYSLEEYFAWGSGRDYALGAMAHGASAIEAVKATIKHADGCGDPVVAFDLLQGIRLL